MPDASQHEKPASPVSLIVGLGALLIIAGFASISLGSTLLPFSEVWKALTGHAKADPIISQIVFDFRLPRVLTALMAGAALSVAGLLMQTMFRNPLADPFVLGVNSGASLGVAIVLLVLAPSGIALTQSLALSGQVLVVAASSLGAAATLAIILGFAQRVDVMSLLILGLMLSYAIGAIVSILMFHAMAERLQSFFAWSFGEFGNVTWQQFQVFAPAIAIGLAISLFLIKSLDAFLLGERYAESLGIRTATTRVLVLGIASILAGTVTGFCGPIGFLGIAAPHLARYLLKTAQHRILLPASMLLGSLVAIIADLMAKAPGFDSVLPLNAITALIGAPVIIAALLKQGNLKRMFG